jgi:chromosome segregation ATPase
MFNLAVITGALGGLKTASDLIRNVRDGVKSKQMKLDEVDSRISEVFDHIVEAKVALNDAKDEITLLRAELAKLKDLEEGYEFRDNAYWRDGVAYCPKCLKIDGKHVPLNNLYCGKHDETFLPPGKLNIPFAVIR